MSSYLVVSLLSVIFTVALARFIKTRAVVVGIAALLSAITFQLFVYFDLKYLDPFFLIAFLFSGLLAALVSGLTLFVRHHRSRKQFPVDNP